MAASAADEPLTDGPLPDETSIDEPPATTPSADEPPSTAPSADESPASPSPRRRLRAVLSVGVPLVVLGVLVYVIAAHGHDIVETAKRLKPSELLAITALALVTLICRTEAVIVCLDAMPGTRPQRVDVHSANSLTFVASNVNHYFSAVVRGALVKRLDASRAPTIPQMVVVDTATGLIEALVVAVLVVASAATLNLAWWVPALIIAAGVAGVIAVIVLRRRFGHVNLLRGLDVFSDVRRTLIVSALMIVVIVCQVLRTLIVLRAVGLHPSLIQAVATFVAGGVLSSLFAGPGAGTAGGPLLVFGHHHLAAAATAGLVLSITMLIAGIVYAVPGGPAFLVRMRRPAT
jgi:uncharacterized membrane protein YbhN (UPF0104 family)